jgi:serine/threonine-protein kinase
MIGTNLAHYRIIEELGRGGMGVVYKAEDTKLDRVVAIKLLPPNTLATEEESARFYREARAAAALHHPNVATVFEINELLVPGGAAQPYIVIEYVDGKSLSDVIAEGTLAREEAVSIMVQIADGLHAAHEKGIVHRDIKPANIMMSSDGRPKILDFGVARLEREAALTQTGSTIGTTAYMSPEQVRAEPVDRRSDLWSLGIVFHELLSGLRPFQGDYEAAITFAIMNEEPALAGDLSDDLRTVLHKLLAKNSADRYQNASDVADDLRGVTQPIYSARTQATIAPEPPSRTVSRRTILSAVVGLAVVVAAAFIYFLVPGSPIDSIAVLPFRNAGDDPDLDYLSDGLTESLINSLSQVPDLRVMARSTVFQYKGQVVSPRQVGDDLGVRAVLVGDVTQRGQDLRINAELVDVSDGTQLWGGVFNRPLSDIIQIQDALADQILDGLKVSLSGEARERVVDSGTQDSEAYQLYLKGLFNWNKRTGDALLAALNYFQQAVDADPEYALGYAGLANTYSLMSLYGLRPPGEVQPLARAAARRALELDDGLAEAYAGLAAVQWSYDWDWEAAEQSYKRALSANPNYASGRQWYGELLASRGRLDESIAELRTALELDPLSVQIRGVLGSYLLLADREQEGLDQLQQTVELEPRALYALWLLSTYHLVRGDWEVGADYLRRTLEIDEAPVIIPLLAFQYVAQGRPDRAREVLVKLDEMSKDRWVSRYNYALVYVALGDRDAAFENFRMAVEERSDMLVYLEADLTLGSIRDDPRYDEILDAVGLVRWAD